MKELLLKVLGGFKKSANIIFSLDEDIFDRFFNNEYFKDGIKKITIELGNGDTINLESKTILDFKFYIKDKNKKKEFTNSSNDIISTKEMLKHSAPVPRGRICYNTLGRQQGKSWYYELWKQVWTEKQLREEEGLEFIDVDIAKDEDQDDIGNEIIETINKRKITAFSKELDITNIKQSEDEYFDDIKPMIVKRDNK